MRVGGVDGIEINLVADNYKKNNTVSADAVKAFGGRDIAPFIPNLIIVRRSMVSLTFRLPYCG